METDRKKADPKFLIDACLTRALTQHLLHHRGLDAAHVDRRLPPKTGDDQVFALARAEKRVVVTENAGDFGRLVAIEPAHPGLLLVAAGLGKARQLEFVTVAIDRMLDDTEAGRSLIGSIYEVNATGAVRRR